MLIDKFLRKETLADLWHEVFGDSYSYINLIFNKEYNDSILCFAETENEKVVSAFYLLKNTLKFEGRIYNGYYLYAAATLDSYRGKGIMGRLINEAELYCRNAGADFISLVPSQESLYSYYKRFGFRSAMYRYKELPDYNELINIDRDAYYSYRTSLDLNYMNFDKCAFSYAADCFGATGTGFYKDCENGTFFCIDDENEIVEAISDNPCFADEKIPFGMIFPINNKLIRDWNYTDIYMNIALD